MIKLQVIGHLGKDGLLKEVNGKSVINFTVAHSERYKDIQGVQKERTTWVDCAYWSDKTAIAPYLVKGQLVYVEGSVEAEAFMNKENQPTATLRMRVTNIQLLGSKNTNGDGQGSAPANTNSYSNPSQASAPYVAPMAADAAADDLPF